MRGRDLATRPKGAISRALIERQEEGSQAHHDASYRIDPLARRIGSVGDPGTASAHASFLDRAVASQPSQASAPLLQMQRHYGNRHVQRVIAIARQCAGGGEASSEVEPAIQRARSGGQSLTRTARTQMEPAFGADFSNVRVHTGSQADTLNQSLGARAFTTGRDIFSVGGNTLPAARRGRNCWPTN